MRFMRFWVSNPLISNRILWWSYWLKPYPNFYVSELLIIKGWWRKLARRYLPTYQGGLINPMLTLYYIYRSGQRFLEAPGNLRPWACLHICIFSLPLRGSEPPAPGSLYGGVEELVLLEPRKARGVVGGRKLSNIMARRSGRTSEI